uniref:Transposon Ty3-G Gag-Pol polyprotein n=1 Tax=Cajanus cajan TaxID=3821 RepID=A0A151QQ51_CAJCA|nr:Transposon Ty3-G Gag-Pol polyprotein [Cajanus cajan]
MAEHTRLKEIQAELKTQGSEIQRLLERFELRDRQQREYNDKKETENQAQFDQIQATLDRLLVKKNNTQHHEESTMNVVLPMKDISLEFPHFDGNSSVLGWVFKAEKFFNYHNTPNASRVEIAAMHFDGDVVPWFQMLQRLAAVNTWADLTRALESQFGPSPFDCPMSELFKLQQSGSVLDYYLKFMSLANRSFGLNDEALLKCFMSGLNADIKRDVMALLPKSLLRAVAQYLFLQLEEDDRVESETIEEVVVKDVKNTAMGGHHLSLNALKGGVGVGTIRFLAYIDKLPVQVLIDGGSSDNFLQSRVAKFLKLPVEPASMFKVMVGNGNYMSAEGVLQQLNVQAQGHSFVLPVFLLPIFCADLIFGASWLKTIGSHIADFEALQLKFLKDGKFVTLQGDKDLILAQAQLHHMITCLPPYGYFFANPTSLPPSRSHDHSILLLEGSNPIPTVDEFIDELFGAYFFRTHKDHYECLRSAGMTPFQVVFGRFTPQIVRYNHHPKDSIYVQETLKDRDQLLLQLKAKLLKSQNYMKQQVDKRRRDIQLDVGDFVLVKLQPYKQQFLALRKHQKLGLRFLGPFEVIQKIVSVAYKLKLPETAKIHPVFTFPCLRDFMFYNVE